jgi:hypothetical protein
MAPEGNRNDLISRVGTFFLLLGILLVSLFIMSDAVQSTKFNYFFLGGASLVVGLYFKRNSWKPAKPSNRFESIRRFQQRQKEAKAKKQQAAKKK